MKRILTAIVLLPFALAAVLWLPLGWFWVLIVALVEVCVWEFVQITAKWAPGSPRWLLLLTVPVTSALLSLLLYDAADTELLWTLMLTFLVLLSVGIGVLLLTLRTPVEETAAAFGVVGWGTGYFSVAAASLWALEAIDPWVLVLLLAVVWLGDSAALYVGRMFGRHRLAPIVSPRKSWEGSMASLAAGLFAALGMELASARGAAVGRGGGGGGCRPAGADGRPRRVDVQARCGSQRLRPPAAGARRHVGSAGRLALCCAGDAAGSLAHRSRRQCSPMAMSTRLGILGSTGSVGSSVLEVVRHHPEHLEVSALAALGSDLEAVCRQVEEFGPSLVAIHDPAAAAELAGMVGEGVEVVPGDEGLERLVTEPQVDRVVAAMVGAAGLAPVYRALEAGKDVALANKEVLVVAGHLVTALARRRGLSILPIDSEHVALHQALRCGRPEEVRRLVLTASGGPFRERPSRDLRVDHPR